MRGAVSSVKDTVPFPPNHDWENRDAAKTEGFGWWQSLYGQQCFKSSDSANDQGRWKL